MKKLVLIMLASFMFVTSANAASYIHQVEGLFDVDQRKFDPDGAGATWDFDVFKLNLLYRNQYKSRTFLVGNLDFSNGALDYIGFGGGAEYNLLKDPSDKVEAGAGILFNLYTGDISGFGMRPYGFARAFVKGGFFISGQLSYDLAFVEVNDTDGDIKGIRITAGFGYAL